jgi:serine/threonine protein kinase
VLDFDLSWHEGAREKSVIHTTVLGYLAPEQVTEGSPYSTRSSLVDSFGIGMTLFFLCAGRDPAPSESGTALWLDSVRTAVHGVSPASWQSTPTRVARLIDGCTRVEQSSRWDLAQVQAEIERLHAAVLDPSSVSSAELLAEEVAARAEYMRSYVWNQDRPEAVRQLGSGVVCVVAADSPNERICLTLSWNASGVEQREDIAKYLPRKVDKAVSDLRAAGWAEGPRAVEGQSFRLEFDCKAETASRGLDQLSDGIDAALGELTFSSS